MKMTKEDYYLSIAEAVSRKGTCLRRNFGAIIVIDDHIISTGYTGSPRKAPNCNDIGQCLREKYNIPHGERYELCRSVHAEMNAIIHASREQMIGATMYLVGFDFKTNDIVSDAEPCKMCKRIIMNSGVERVIVRRGPKETVTLTPWEWVENVEEIFAGESEY
ncbi:MAG: dCMP deaminase family protein [candidate division Zixibacteria bacterium]|nr:dCMP deaminase family protein [candidate division Zixibacteria bacterium]MDH3938145.1 dCMP deaminase family protein [candidate division Zixibacteria bacterium]MDH4033048.1 dCMP deaminase family protein [candidate division Zixibacteria bacterium]